jgi:hypothetical protein
LTIFHLFKEAFPVLFDKAALRKHYSDAVLWTDDARIAWVEPDKIPMP